MLSSENYFNIPESRFKLSLNEKTKIMELIDRSGSMIITTELSFVEPIITRYVLNIGLIIFQGAGYPSEEVIRQNILNKLSDYFISMRRRDRIPRSDLIAIVESVHGVDSVNITALSEEDEKVFASNPNAVGTRIDEFGDLIFDKSNIPVIRGGWTDRRGLRYEPGLDPEKPSCVNIVVKQVVNQTYNSMVNDQTKSNIVNS